jgi:CYTH domain-containing protein
MPLEIERKFLVLGDAWRSAPHRYICQGYLNRDKGRTVRVRIAGEDAWLTIKGPSNGAVRAEFEYAVPVEDARQMLALCERPLIEKNRHLVQHQGHTWEVDEFLGDNAGLVVAEIELESEQEAFELPAWVGAEVTQDARYFNSNLATHPYSQWKVAGR